MTQPDARPHDIDFRLYSSFNARQAHIKLKITIAIILCIIPKMKWLIIKIWYFHNLIPIKKLGQKFIFFSSAETNQNEDEKVNFRCFNWKIECLSIFCGGETEIDIWRRKKGKNLLLIRLNSAFHQVIRFTIYNLQAAARVWLCNALPWCWPWPRQLLGYVWIESLVWKPFLKSIHGITVWNDVTWDMIWYALRFIPQLRAFDFRMSNHHIQNVNYERLINSYAKFALQMSENLNLSRFNFTLSVLMSTHSLVCGCQWLVTTGYDEN